MKNVTNTVGKKVICVLLSFAVLFSMSVLAVNASSSSTNTDLVVLVKFKGDTADDFNSGNAWKNLKAYYNDTSDLHTNLGINEDYSFKNYLKLISRGAINIENYFPQDKGSTVSVLELQNAYGYYTDDYYVLREVMAAFNNGTLTLPTAKLDNQESGMLDCLTIIIQGNSNEHPDDQVLYSHKGIAGSSELICNKYMVGGYIIMDSYNVITSQRTGVITHEYMHILGFPDLYRLYTSGKPVGLWDIMAQVGDYKQYPLSYMRAIHGWVPLREGKTTGTYTLDAATLNTDNAVIKFQTPMSDTEFFCVEYRKKKTENVIAGIGIETKIPDSGLLIYRVNNSIENHSNIAGNDYIYVFRPNDTSTTAGEGDVLDAAITPSKGETSYGSADFSKGVTDNAIFYSTGKNSGLVFNNVTVSADGNSITFDVTFPDYSSLDLWDKVGDTFASSVSGNVYMDIDSNANVYAALQKMGDWDYSTQVYKYNGSTWSALGAEVTGAYDPKIKCFNNNVYYTYCDSNGRPVIKRWTGSAWATIATITNASYPMSLDFFADDSHLYITYAVNNNNIVIQEVTNSGITLIDNSLKAPDSFGNFAATSYGGKIYALYSYFSWSSSSDRATYISEFDLTTKKWTQVQSFNIVNANIHSITAKDGILYALTGLSGKQPLIATYDGNEWNQETAAITSTNYSGLSLDVAGDEPYIVYSSSKSLKIDKKSNDGWANIGEITYDCTYFDFMFVGGKAYAAAVSDGNANVGVFTKTLWYEPIKISAPSYKVAAGKTMKLTVTGGDGTYFYSTSEIKDLSVSSDGIVKGISQGGATITVTDSVGNKATEFIKVTPSNGKIHIYVISGNQKQKVDWWKKYSSTKIKLAYEDYDCETAVRYKWTSSGTGIKVSSNGTVTNYSLFSRSSTITMTAYDADGNIVATSNIKVIFYKTANQLKSFTI